MIKALLELYSLLSATQKINLFYLQLLVLLMSFLEMLGVFSIGPFLALVGDSSLLVQDHVLKDLYEYAGIVDQNTFMFWLGIVVILFLVFASLISMITVWRLSMYGARLGADLSSRLFRFYLHQTWLFHSQGNSSHLTKQLAQECQRVSSNVIRPLMQMNAKLVFVIFMTIAIFIFNPLVALSAVSIFFSAYYLLYKMVRSRIVRNGKSISRLQSERYQVMSEGFGGIKDILLLSRQNNFVQRFISLSEEFATASGENTALGQLPRYAIELLAYISVITLVLYLIVTYEGDLGVILPMLSVYALAGFKLLPAFQQIYSSFTLIKSHLAAYNAIRDELLKSTLLDISGTSSNYSVKTRFNKTIKFRNITFIYPGKKEPALNSLNLEIESKQIIGLVGPSGSGKSTFTDILLGLIDPSSGQIFIDGEILSNNNKQNWQKNLGFVPQSIFLSDATIKENIAFGISQELIDHDKITKVIKLAHIDEFLNDLPDGINTKVGERGVQLSGGQRQRIGIARALYDDSEVLVLDEATSALDGITEKNVMKAILDFSGKKTIIIIAHRLSTVKNCDQIYIMDKGKVIDFGKYDDLFNRNSIFKKMAI